MTALAPRRQNGPDAFFEELLLFSGNGLAVDRRQKGKGEQACQDEILGRIHIVCLTGDTS